VAGAGDWDTTRTLGGATPVGYPPYGGTDTGGAPDGAAATDGDESRSRFRVSRRALLIGVPAVAALAGAGAVATVLTTQARKGSPGGTPGAGSTPGSPGTRGTPNATPTRPRPSAVPGGPMPEDPLLVRLTVPGGTSIYSISPGGEQRKAITSALSDVLPQWSHDRSKLVFVRRLGSAWQVITADADGGNARVILENVARGTRVCWSPDDRRLAYMSPVNGVTQLFTVDVNQPVPVQVTRTGEGKDDPTWNPFDDNLIAFWSTVSGRSRIVAVRLDNPDAQRLQLTSDASATAVDPCFSPDGNLIAYTNSTAPNQGNIWVVNADGTGNRAVTSGPQLDMDPTWSPDGGWIAFTRGLISRPSVFAVRPDGTDLKKITVGDALEGHASWS
jgi:Tol biopolymer transport system component